MTNSELHTVVRVANSNSSGSIYAQSVLSDFHKNEVVRFPEHVPINSTMVTNGTDSSDSIQEVKSSEFTVYPNPSEGSVTIELEIAVTGNVIIIDALGRITAQFNLSDEEYMYQVNNLPNGIYTVIVTFTDGSGQTEKLLVE